MTSDSVIQEIELPAWVNWLAMDADGCWWCYQAEPHQHESGWYENEVGRVERIGSIQAKHIHWRDSLIRVAK